MCVCGGEDRERQTQRDSKRDTMKGRGVCVCVHACTFMGVRTCVRARARATWDFCTQGSHINVLTEVCDFLHTVPLLQEALDLPVVVVLFKTQFAFP